MASGHDVAATCGFEFRPGQAIFTDGDTLAVEGWPLRARAYRLSGTGDVGSSLRTLPASIRRLSAMVRSGAQVGDVVEKPN